MPSMVEERVGPLSLRCARAPAAPRNDKEPGHEVRALVRRGAARGGALTTASCGPCRGRARHASRRPWPACRWTLARIRAGAMVLLGRRADRSAVVAVLATDGIGLGDRGDRLAVGVRGRVDRGILGGRDGLRHRADSGGGCLGVARLVGRIVGRLLGAVGRRSERCAHGRDRGRRPVRALVRVVRVLVRLVGGCLRVARVTVAVGDRAHVAAVVAVLAADPVAVGRLADGDRAVAIGVDGGERRGSSDGIGRERPARIDPRCRCRRGRRSPATCRIRGGRQPRARSGPRRGEGRCPRPARPNEASASRCLFLAPDCRVEARPIVAGCLTHAEYRGRWRPPATRTFGR